MAKWQTYSTNNTLQGAKNSLARAEKQLKMKAGKDLKIVPRTETYRGRRKTIGFRVIFR